MKRLFASAILLTVLITCFPNCKKNCTNSDRCNLTPDPGVCLAAFPKFYYDKVEKKCKQFTWGGCGGVVPFETMQECENACGCK